MQAIYKQDAAATKPFKIDMVDFEGNKAQLLIKIEFKPTVSEAKTGITEGKKPVDSTEIIFDNSKEQLKPAKMAVEDDF